MSQRREQRPELPTQNTAATAKTSQTTNTMATAKTSKTNQTQNEELNLAGPPAHEFKHSPYHTYFEEGYEDANPWMKDDTRTQEFSLAHVFPRTVRWKGPQHQEQEKKKKDHVKDEEGEKGGSEPATQVTEAEDQREKRECASRRNPPPSPYSRGACY